jgi:hypothetical protein
LTQGRVTKVTKISKLGSISDMLRAANLSLIMLALQFATATANLAPQDAFLFLATHGPIFIASSSSATLIQCGFQSEVGDGHLRHLVTVVPVVGATALATEEV